MFLKEFRPDGYTSGNMDMRSGFPESAQKVSVLVGIQTTRGPQNLGGPENQLDMLKRANFGPENVSRLLGVFCLENFSSAYFRRQFVLLTYRFRELLL